MIEREHLLTELATTYATAARGQGRVAVVDGGVASGKTALVAAVAELAADDGALVLTATCSLAESALPLGVVRQLFQALPPPLRPDDGPYALPLDTPFETDPPALDSPQLRHSEAQLLEDTCQKLLECAADRPLVIVVDDVHFADRLSLQALLYLQRRIRSAPVLLVLSGCIGAEPAGPAFRAELTRQPHCRHLRLLPLSRDGVRKLLAQRLPVEVAERLAEPAHALSRGNPLLVRALVDDLHASGTVDDPTELVVGDAFVEAALDCLHRSDPRMLDVMRALAIVGPGASADLLAALVDLPPATIRQILGVFGDADPTGHRSYHHPAVRAAVLDDCPPDKQSALRLRAARLLHERNAPAAEVAEHLVAVAEPVEPWAVPVLTAAAEAAVADGDTSRAVSGLELALASATHDQQRATVRTALVRLHWRETPAKVVPHLTPLRDDFHAGMLDTADALLLARSLAWHGRHDDAVDVLTAVGDLATHPDPDLVADYHATRDWLRQCRPDDADGAVAPATFPGATDRAEEVLQRARVADSVLVAVWHALRVLIHADKLDRADHWCERLYEEAEARDVASWRAVLSDVRAATALRRGDLAATERHARAALTAMSAASWGVAVGSPLSHLILACTMSGQAAQAEQALRQPVPVAMRHSVFWLPYLRARGTYYDAMERRHAALADFQTVGELAVRWGADDPGALPWRVDLARMHVRMGRPEQARQLITDHLALPGGDSPRAKGMGLRVLASTCPPKKRQAMLREAMDLLYTSGDRHELAHAFADLSKAGHALGEFSRARMMGVRALQLAEGCHAGLLRQKLEPFRDKTNRCERPALEGVAALSDAERRVVSLAARGHTNREISRKLFITVSTVEQHLTRAYRKLKISRRTELVPIEPPEEAFA